MTSTIKVDNIAKKFSNIVNKCSNNDYSWNR